MQLNHLANRLHIRHFDIIMEMLKVKLGFVELRRNERAIWMRQAAVRHGRRWTGHPRGAALQAFEMMHVSVVPVGRVM